MATATARLDFRISPASKGRIDRAARLTGEPVTAFVRSAAEERAERVLREHEWTTTVPAEFFDDLMAALQEPPRPNSALAGAAARLSHAVDRG
jgi:uncharacterized protein (DUF1778 family)